MHRNASYVFPVFFNCEYNAYRREKFLTVSLHDPAQKTGFAFSVDAVHESIESLAMNRHTKWTAAVLILLIFFTEAAADGLSVDPVMETLRPGRPVLLGFDVPVSGEASMFYCLEPDGEAISTVAENMEVTEGRNGVWWNGTFEGTPAPEGEGYLVLRQGGESTATPVTVGPPYPAFDEIRLTDEVHTPDSPSGISMDLSCSGQVQLTVRQEERSMLLDLGEMEEGLHTVPLELTDLKDGTADITVQLTDSEGNTVLSEQMPLQVSGFDAQHEEETVLAEALGTDEVYAGYEEEEEIIIARMDQTIYTPNYGSPWYGTDPDVNYWTLPMDITDEDAVWQMLMRPITVVDTGKKNAEKTQVIIRAEPDEKAGGVGAVTCVTQGVHVLETLDNGWSLIECYSSSFHDSKIKAWNLLVQGYVRTSLLKTSVPDDEIAFVIDKLTQRMYIFRDGHLFSTLIVSTGLANERQPYNETRSGEFLLQLPAVGEFRSDNLYCSMGIRFNDGDLIHEVPHQKNKDGSKNYSTTEYKLGSRGSHGCIRVQRRLTPEGTNMLWIWKNKKPNMKLVIWEDWQGRQIPYPSDDTVVYYNPDGGESYHSSETCYSSKNTVFSPITYGEINQEAYSHLTRCTYCTPPMSKAEIDEINLLHAPGGDHDPILTEARAKQAAVQ